MERVEAEAVFDAGRDRCVEFVLELAGVLERLSAANARLEERVLVLEEQSRVDSRTSWRPPSSDPPKTRAERRREAREQAKAWAKRNGEEKRKAGGQPGHEGAGRELLPEDRIDEIVDRSLPRDVWWLRTRVHSSGEDSVVSSRAPPASRTAAGHGRVCRASHAPVALPWL